MREHFGDSFMRAYTRVLFDWVKEETVQLDRQPLPGSITEADLDMFSYKTYYEELGIAAPILHSAIRGGMASNFSYDQVHSTTDYTVHTAPLIVQYTSTLCSVLCSVHSSLQTSYAPVICTLTLYRSHGDSLSAVRKDPGRSPCTQVSARLSAPAT